MGSRVSVVHDAEQNVRLWEAGISHIAGDQKNSSTSMSRGDTCRWDGTLSLALRFSARVEHVSTKLLSKMIKPITGASGSIWTGPTAGSNNVYNISDSNYQTSDYKNITRLFAYFDKNIAEQQHLINQAITFVENAKKVFKAT